MASRLDEFIQAGLQAKWTKVRGSPVIAIRNPNSSMEHQRTKWWIVDQDMQKRAEEVGIMQAFDEHTMLGDLFSI